MILAGDIGGTNSRLALFEIRKARLIMRERSDTKNAGQRSLVEIARKFLEREGRPVEVACFGVAGPVKDGRVKLTNLSWTLDAKKMSRELKIPRIALINDLVAHAEGTNVLTSNNLVTINKGKPARGGNRAIIAPGTGLGEGGLLFDHHSNDYRAFASEGGHSDFAPRTDREAALMKFVRAKLDRCDAEDVISGMGLENIWKFLMRPGPFHVQPKLSMKNPKPPDITSAAMKRSCPACLTATEIFAEALAAEAGNLACKILATGGIFIGGGIPPHILRFLQSPQFKKIFASKGLPSIRKVLQAMPIHVILSPDNALYGAAHYARRM